MNRNRTQRPLKHLRLNAIAVLLSLGCLPVLATDTAPGLPSNNLDLPRSAFTLPSDPRAGRDPFFPDSTRPYVTTTVAPARVADVTSLVLKGFSGTLDHRLVIINNHTFAVGDEGDVVTPDGRIHLSCIEIKTNSVVIEVGGQRHELLYTNMP